MGVKWTDEQQKVIDLRDRNILVSAAAGSGKTAVLVERIIKRITDENNPTDIDRILVVTFTKAAAAEMRERISEAIEKLREANPEDENLERQATLIHNAQITTIDSFCLFVVRNHFGEINLDPNFRIADQGEIKLLENDVLNEYFEHNYECENNESFLQLIDLYSGSRNDDKVRDMVMKIYKMSQSDSWPKAWIAGLGDLYKVSSDEELVNQPIIKEIVSYIRAFINDYIDVLEELIEISLSSKGPEKYVPTLYADIDILKHILEAKNYTELYNSFESISFGNLSAIRDKEVNEEKKARVQNERNAIKKAITGFKQTYFANDISKLREQLGGMSQTIDELIRLATGYTVAIEEKKADKRIVDFGDVEHFALKIFVDETTGEATSTAKSFREHFDEIMIDEYQDSNQIQEDILCSISRIDDGHPNMFMVGDVKQSIYRFRLARPELFMGKYERYSVEDSLNQRIDLHKNFRSRKEVLDFTNDIFYKIMQSDMGSVAYDDDAALYLGASYVESDDKKAELLLIDTKDENFDELIDGNDTKGIQIEALAIGHKIKELMQNMQITDKKTNELRSLKYSDIVILFRGIKANGADYVSVLAECGIPAHIESQTGYFESYEIQIILNMLRILDNPYQDIPMTAVLKSAIVDLDDEELAEIRIKDQQKPFCKLVIEEMEAACEGKLYEFNKLYKELRSIIKDTPIHEVISILLERTGFRRYVAAMPAGERRLLNLNMLIERAIDYEKTSYKGLFHFIRYIDQLHKYEIDFGEADTMGENDDVVHIMTIHKSKGLEFPIVFVSGLGKNINQRDATDNLVIHTSLGIGIDEISGSPKTKKKCLVKNEIANRTMLENLGEELRVLYVALTRAKEKLILTGCIKNAQKAFEKYVGNVIKNKPISFAQRAGAKNYLDWIIPAMMSYPDKYTIDFVSADELADREAKNMAQLTLERSILEAKINQADEALIQELTSSFEYKYPYETEVNKKSKYSVSELKHESMVEKYDGIELESEAERPEFCKSQTKESYIPKFAMQIGEDSSQENMTNVSNEVVNPGALRGTAVHRVMECLDFKKIANLDISTESTVYEFIDEQMNAMLQSGLVTEDMIELVPKHMVFNFIKSPVAKRMATADEKGLLFKEKPFVMSKDDVLIQGIIDVFWLEDDHVVLLDYKTDRVKAADELVLRYKTQLDLYRDALGRIFSTDEKEIKAEESLIYSFKLKEVIQV